MDACIWQYGIIAVIMFAAMMFVAMMFAAMMFAAMMRHCQEMRR